MKEQLARLIEMYASARATSNQDLTNYAATELNDFLKKVEVVEMPPAAPPHQLQQENPAE